MTLFSSSMEGKYADNYSAV